MWGSSTSCLILAFFSVIISHLHLPLWDCFLLCYFEVFMSRRQFWLPPPGSKKKSALWICLLAPVPPSFFLSLILSTLLSSLFWNRGQLVVFVWEPVLTLFFPATLCSMHSPQQWKRSVLTTGPPGKSLCWLLTLFISHSFVPKSLQSSHEQLLLQGSLPGTAELTFVKTTTPVRHSFLGTSGASCCPKDEIHHPRPGAWLSHNEQCILQPHLPLFSSEKTSLWLGCPESSPLNPHISSSNLSSDANIFSRKPFLIHQATAISP